MTVKIGIGGSALDLKDAKVWGYQATKIMVGTGTTAIEAWPPYRTSNQIVTSVGTSMISAPAWARYVRVVLISGGGGGGGGNGGNFASGEGGGGGRWSSGTITLSSTSLSVTAGPGGNGGSTIGVAGSTGGTSAVYNGPSSVTATGGSGGRGGAPGTGVNGGTTPSYTPFSDIPTLYGGAGGTQDRDGSPPGGGGGGGGGGIFNGGSGGRPGGRGQVWLYFYSHDPRN